MILLHEVLGNARAVMSSIKMAAPPASLASVVVKCDFCRMAFFADVCSECTFQAAFTAG